jgi:hypothetical protein
MRFTRGMLASTLAAALGASAGVASAEDPNAQVMLNQQIEAMGQSATSRTEFVLDRPMIAFASKMINQDDGATKRVLAGLNTISVHSYGYREPGLYSPMDLESIRKEFHLAGWQHLVSTKPHIDKTGMSDLWIHFRGTEVTDVAVLVSGPTQLAFVQFDGTVRPLDLLHLSGHMGIPKFDEDDMVKTDH